MENISVAGSRLLPLPVAGSVASRRLLLPGPPGPRWPDPPWHAHVPAQRPDSPRHALVLARGGWIHPGVPSSLRAAAGSALLRPRPGASSSRLTTLARAGGCPHKDSDEGSSSRSVLRGADQLLLLLRYWRCPMRSDRRCSLGSTPCQGGG